MAYTTARTGYAPVNGLQMYHEIHGTAPALVVIGDSDVVGPEHAVRMFRLLGGGVAGDVAGLPASRLAVLPGTTHITLVDRVDWLLSMITEFLDAPMQARIQPAPSPTAEASTY